MTAKLRERDSRGFYAETPQAPLNIAELAGRYRAALNAYFTRRVRNREEAEDLTQEVFLRVTRSEQPQGIQAVGAFLFRIARNLVFDRARADKARSDRYAQVENLQFSADQLSPERVIEAREALQSVAATLGQLNERTREIFLLHRLENMSYDEIAEVYGISRSAVAKHMMKALVSLGEHLDLP